MTKLTKQQIEQEPEFEPRRRGDEKDFGGTLRMQKDRMYNIELPNNDCIVLTCFDDGKQGQMLRVISEPAWCDETAIEVQTRHEDKHFKANGKTSKSEKERVLCKNPECQFCAFLARVWHIERKTD